MLNCTNLECILHHHHYYAQLHHLTHGTHVEDASDSEEFNDDTIQGLLNDTDSELSNLSHVDAPNDSVYMIGGVLIAMFLVGVIIILLAVTINKLRKREEHSNSVHPTDVVLHQTTTTTTTTTIQQQTTQLMTIPQQPPAVVLSTNHPASNGPQLNGDSVTFKTPYALWQYPPQPQPLYNNTQEHVQTAITEQQQQQQQRPSFVRGFRRNLGGQWRRLVKRKPVTEAHTIPAELRPQLKQIYVY